MRIIFTLIFLIIHLSCQVTTKNNNAPVVTVITGLWDVGRGKTSLPFKRDFSLYLQYLEAWINTSQNVIFFGDKELIQFVKKHRTRTNTVYIQKNVEWFEKRWYTPLIKKVIAFAKNENEVTFHNFYERYVQYGCEMYNPVLMSKTFMMSEAQQYDIFDSDYYVWIDGGLTHVEQLNSFIPNNYFVRMPLLFPSPWIYHTQITANPMIGFRGGEKMYSRKQSFSFLVWGGYFGGRVDAASTVVGIYENFLRMTLEQNQMWTEETLFTLMVQRYNYLLHYVEQLTLSHLEKIGYSNYYIVEREQRPYIVYNLAQNDFQHLILINKSTSTSSYYAPVITFQIKRQAITDTDTDTDDMDIIWELLSTLSLIFGYGCLKWKLKKQKQL